MSERGGFGELDALFRELSALSSLVSEHHDKHAETVILPDNSLSLVEQIASFEGEERKRPVIRTVHHFACTGGTLLSKCLSALPNTYLLSEVHPFSPLEFGGERINFSPSGISKLANYANVPDLRGLANKIFESAVWLASQHVDQYGGKLILRDHAHSDYCVGKDIARSSSLRSLLGNKFTALSVATVRDPIDSYLSLCRNGWDHFEPATFDEYCKRYLQFLSEFSEDRILRYEDFVEHPEREMMKLACLLDLQFDAAFVDTFSIFNVTGDSGRKSDSISLRPRRDTPDHLLAELKSSDNYKMLSDKLKYT